MQSQSTAKTNAILPIGRLANRFTVQFFKKKPMKTSQLYAAVQQVVHKYFPKYPHKSLAIPIFTPKLSLSCNYQIVNMLVPRLSGKLPFTWGPPCSRIVWHDLTLCHGNAVELQILWK